LADCALPLLPALVAAACFAASPPPQEVETLARVYHKQPTAANQAILIRYAAAHPKDRSGGLALLALANEDILAKRTPDAIARLKEVGPRLKPIADYVAYLTALSQFDLGDDKAAIASTDNVFAVEPKAPLAGQAAILAARAWTRAGDPRQALNILKQRYDALPQPDGDLALAAAFEAAQDPISAAAYYQRVYYRRPLATGAAATEAALERLKAMLGPSFPAPMPQMELARAMALMDGRAYAQAQRELDELAPGLGGPDRDSALLLAGVARYHQNDNTATLRYFESLQVSSPESDAERLYYVVESARRLKNLDQSSGVLDDLAQRYPQSRWRLRSIVSLANNYLLQNDAASYTPLYQACYESFPVSDLAAGCHWKVVFSGYLRRRPDAAEGLKDHLRRYPRSENAGAALYFLGRLAETNSNWGDSRVYYEEITRAFPNDYYGVLARARLLEPAVHRAAATASVKTFLASIAFPPRARRMDFEADENSRVRIARSRLLASAGLDQYAEMELGYGAKVGNQPSVMAVELARSAERRDAPEQGIRYIKRYAAGYLSMPLDSAPEEFWRLAFPLPYQDVVETYSRANGLDPYLVAALIRQESEFDPKAISRARAYGLTQVLPATGRLLSRQVGLPKFNSNLLFQPDVNIRLGTFFMKSLVTGLDGRVEAALAAYNAGKNRATAWLAWQDFQEPAEFIEAIPFSETRNYVQIVMRNADIYRRLYGPRH
jgi:soluble lytic murein transglycosylase